MKLRHVKIGVAFESRVYNDKLRAKDSFSLFFFFFGTKEKCPSFTVSRGYSVICYPG